MPTALITLRDGKRYAASQVKLDDGWVRAECRRFMRVGLNGERTRFYGPLRWRSWPSEAVWEVEAVKPSGDVPEGASAAPVQS